MNFKEEDKPITKSINSNMVRAERTEEDISRLEYLTKVVSDATVFSIILKNRGDFEHSKKYIETAININDIIRNILQREYNSIFTSYYMEKDKKQ